MINTLTRAATLGAVMTAAILATVAPAFSQAPTQAQRDAIKSQCRSDYMAHCSSVPPGGEASLQCLQKNMSSLSRAAKARCARWKRRQRRRRLNPRRRRPRLRPLRRPRPQSPRLQCRQRPSTAAKQPTSAQISAIRSACRSDYPKVCAGVPTGGAPALQCLEKNKAKLSPACEKAVAAASGGGAAPRGAPRQRRSGGRCRCARRRQS